MPRFSYYIYIVTSKRNTVLYIGVTNNLKRRVQEHKERLNKASFASRYNADKLVYFEHFTRILDAIQREKRLKKMEA